MILNQLYEISKIRFHCVSFFFFFDKMTAKIILELLI